jgi:hypothetical protein
MAFGLTESPVPDILPGGWKAGRLGSRKAGKLEGQKSVLAGITIYIAINSMSALF